MDTLLQHTLVDLTHRDHNARMTRVDHDKGVERNDAQDHDDDYRDHDPLDFDFFF